MPQQLPPGQLVFRPVATRPATIGPDDFSGLRHLAARTGGDFIAGVVLYTGTQTLPFGSKMRAMPAATLWEV